MTCSIRPSWIRRGRTMDPSSSLGSHPRGSDSSPMIGLDAERWLATCANSKADKTKSGRCGLSGASGRRPPSSAPGWLRAKAPNRPDQRFNKAFMRALSNPMTTSPSTTRAGAERTPRLNSSSRASSSIIRSFLTNSIPLPARYSDSAVQGPQKGCEYKVICRSPISFPLRFFPGLLQLSGLLLPCLPQQFLPAAPPHPLK